MRTPYPRTPHLPWSPGASADDVRVVDLDGLRAQAYFGVQGVPTDELSRFSFGSHDTHAENPVS
ncbi:hypothetical protein AB0G02_35955, partial [Actinosynnema sp. NPDC023658]|uniref:hypothetical protein n=1 Tax=Actinosynnema sp. NPDC023658 TaxID=3155465 RepID=UPI0033C5894B